MSDVEAAARGAPLERPSQPVLSAKPRSRRSAALSWAAWREALGSEWLRVGRSARHATPGSAWCATILSRPPPRHRSSRPPCHLSLAGLGAQEKRPTP